MMSGSASKLTNAFSKMVLTPPNSPFVNRRALSNITRSKSAEISPFSSPRSTTTSSPILSPRNFNSKRQFCSSTIIDHDNRLEEVRQSSNLPNPEVRIVPPAVSPSQWTTQGSKRQLLQKNSQQHWNDMYDNQKDFVCSRLDRVHNTVHPAEEDLQPTKWYSERHLDPASHQTKQDTLSLNIHEINTSLSSTYSPDQVRLVRFSEPAKQSVEEIPQIPYGATIDEHRMYLDSIGRKLGVKTLDDWYNISIVDLKPYNCHEVLAHYGNSLIQALTTMHPEHNWRIWKFNHSYNGLLTSDLDGITIPSMQSHADQNKGTEHKDSWKFKMFSMSNNDSWAHQSAPYIRPENLQKDNLKQFGLSDV